MTNTQHTPGPWRIGDAGFTVFGPPNPGALPVTIAPTKSRANARLIAASPDLLAALQKVVDRATHAKPDSCGQEMRAIRAALIDEARAAIAKATGQ